jgi:hypothetical protein
VAYLRPVAALVLDCAGSGCEEVRAALAGQGGDWDAFVRNEFKAQEALEVGGQRWARPKPPSQQMGMSFLMTDQEIKEKKERQEKIAQALSRMPARNASAASTASTVEERYTNDDDDFGTV